MITAQQARLNFCHEGYVEAIKNVTEAILAASSGNREVEVTIPMGGVKAKPTSFHVAESLRENGFNVSMNHDPDNATTTLYIGW